MIQESLSGEEWTLVSRLRDIPAGAARDELVALLADLLEFVHDPRCPEAQADGVPCRSVQLDCTECQDVVQALTTLRLKLLPHLFVAGRADAVAEHCV